MLNDINKNNGGQPVCTYPEELYATLPVFSVTLACNVVPAGIAEKIHALVILPVVRDVEEGVGRNDLIPFAIDPGGRLFYVSIGESDNGCVYYDVIGLVAEGPVRKIADSLETFISNLEKG